MSFKHRHTHSYTQTHIHTPSPIQSLIASDCDFTLSNISNFVVLNWYKLKVKCWEQLGITFGLVYIITSLLIGFNMGGGDGECKPITTQACYWQHLDITHTYVQCVSDLLFVAHNYTIWSCICFIAVFDLLPLHLKYNKTLQLSTICCTHLFIPLLQEITQLSS